MELICPAGTPASLRAAIEAGAHAVYCGFRDETNARNFPGLNFSRDEAMAFAQTGQTDGAGTATADSTTADTAGDGLDGKAAALMKLIELIQSYASSDEDADTPGANTLSLTA